MREDVRRGRQERTAEHRKKEKKDHKKDHKKGEVRANEGRTKGDVFNPRPRARKFSCNPLLHTHIHSACNAKLTILFRVSLTGYFSFTPYRIFIFSPLFPSSVPFQFPLVIDHFLAHLPINIIMRPSDTDNKFEDFDNYWMCVYDA